MADKENKISKDEKENFKKLIKCAEEYILEKAGKILGTVRERDYSKSTCFDIINEKYRPKYENLEDINIDHILEQFCVELQNYQAMPKAINYASKIEKSDDEDSTDINADKNKIFKTIWEKIKIKLQITI